MGLEIRQDGSAARVDVQDEMTIYTAALHWEQLRPMLAGIKTLELVLAAVTEIDSAGAQLLLALQRESRRLHNTFCITDCSEEVRDLLRLLHLEERLLTTSSNAPDRESRHG